jgi:hypothetical protein
MKCEKVFIIILIMLGLVCFRVLGQTDSVHNKKFNVALGSEFLLGFFPTKISVRVNNKNLSNNFNLCYSYSVEQFDALNGYEIGYSHNFFKKTGVSIGLSYCYFKGQYVYVTGQKYNGYVVFQDLQFLKLQGGLFYRIKFNYFGILEVKANVYYQYFLKDIYWDYKYYNKLWSFYPNLELIYYFKRNKSKK